MMGTSSLNYGMMVSQAYNPDYVFESKGGKP